MSTWKILELSKKIEQSANCIKNLWSIACQENRILKEMRRMKNQVLEKRKNWKKVRCYFLEFELKRESLNHRV